MFLQRHVLRHCRNINPKPVLPAGRPVRSLVNLADDIQRGIKLMSSLIKTTLMGVLLTVMVGLATAEAKADPVTFSTTGVFSVSGTNVVNFTNANGTTTITFNGTTDPVNTPAGTSFGDLVVTTTVP